MLCPNLPRNCRFVSANITTHIVFGVRDNPREVCGLDNPQEVISKITELIKARIDPTPRYQLHAFAEDDKICIDLEIQNGPAYPYYYRFEGVCVAYIRNGDQSEEVSRQQLSALILKGMNKTFDALPSPYHMGDVSFTLLAATFKNALKEDFHPDKDLFQRYGYEYEFRTSHVADVFHVKNSRANLVIRELTAAGILESSHYGMYCFRKKV